MNPFPFADWIITAIFLLALATTVAGALIAVGAARIIRAVSGLALCCIGLAGLYYFLGSPFLALMEILIYVGAVCVTIIFGVMLAEPDEPSLKAESPSLLWITTGLGVGLAILIGIAKVSLGTAWTQPAAPGDGSVAAIGRSLLTTYCAPFELISLVLLVAILGALVIARSGRSKT